MTPAKRYVPAYAPPPPHSLRTIHADDDLIVIDKPSGLLSVPGLGPDKAVCAQQIVNARHGGALTVHRLDMDTSGLMIFARTKAAQRALSRQFERRQIEKTYTCLCTGVPASERGVIDLSIAKHSLSRPLRHVDPEGQKAVTVWRCISTDATSARLSLRPLTGRSHQLRLHLASLGHPILGDCFYGNERSADRLMLHAERLSFVHPSKQTRVVFHAPSPF